MTKKKVTEQSNQLNLTVVALVALVAIVGLVALVLQSANLANVQLATGVEKASADSDDNMVGEAGKSPIVDAASGERRVRKAGSGDY